MSELAEPIRDAAAHLAALEAPERKLGQQQLRALILAQLPDDEIGKPPVRTMGEYLDHDIELPPMLVEPGLVARGAISVLISRGGKGKTAVSLNRLIRWSMGKPLFDELPDLNKPIQPLRTLLIENEGSPGHFQKVLRTILHGNGFEPDDIARARENVTIWGDGGWSGLKVDDDDSFQQIDRAVADTRADIMFLEPFRGLWRGEENSATEMANVLDRLSEIANKHNCAVMVTHHENKSGGGEGGDPMSAARGSSVFEGHCAVMERWLPAKGDRYRELSWIKARFEEAPAPIRMQFERERWGYEYVPEAAGERELLGVLSQYPDAWMSLAELATELEEPQHKLRRWASALLEESPPRLQRKPIDGAHHYRYKPEANGSGDDSGGLAIT